MMYGSRLTVLALAGVMLAGCGRTAHAPPAAASASAAAPSVPAPASGAPLITDSPDLVHIEYHIYGRGEPAVVLIHGWSCNSSYWRAQLDDLKAHYTVVTLDLAGHGASGKNRTDWSIANYAQDVAAVVRQLPAHQVVLVGHSMGGPIALAAAPRIGARVIGIIGVDTSRASGCRRRRTRRSSARSRRFARISSAPCTASSPTCSRPRRILRSCARWPTTWRVPQRTWRSHRSSH